VPDKVLRAPGDLTLDGGHDAGMVGNQRGGAVASRLLPRGLHVAGTAFKNASTPLHLGAVT
jgi:hypothetical protein